MLKGRPQRESAPLTTTGLHDRCPLVDRGSAAR